MRFFTSFVSSLTSWYDRQGYIYAFPINPNAVNAAGYISIDMSDQYVSNEYCYRDKEL